MLSRSKQGIYRSLVNLAWCEYATNAGADLLDRKARDSWYRDELLVSPLHIKTSNQIENEEDFDIVCLHFALASNDYKQIAYWTAASERRALHILATQRKRLKLSQDYVDAIAVHMGFLLPIYDLPAQSIQKLTAALDTHRRRRSGSP